MKAYTPEELKEVLSKHALYLRGGPTGIRANLRSADLRSANLSGAYLSRANLYGANLSGANLSGANLSRANLYGANLSGANLYGANLSGAYLSGANLSGADLSGADLYGADLRSANLSGANLSGADLGARTKLGAKIALLGACSESLRWIDRYVDHSNPMRLYNDASEEFQEWLANKLGCSVSSVTSARLDAVIDFMLAGKFEAIAKSLDLEN